MGLEMDFSKLQPRDVLDLAIYVEEEAEGHYEQMAGWMDSRGVSAIAEFFRAMAKREARHRAQLSERREAMFGSDAPRYSSTLAWEVEAPDYEALGTTPTVREALELALGAETRARDYYQHALEYVSEPQLVELFEGLRQAEVQHQELLKAELARLDG